MKQVIINADDFGYSVGVNTGIIESYRRGVLTSTTIMAGMPGFEHAVKLAAENPGLGIGVHLTLTCGRPLLTGHRTLVCEDGSFPRKPFYLDPETVIDLDEVEREWTAQIERVFAAGIVPDHLDSHHHVHVLKGTGEVLMRLARRYCLPVRNSWNEGGDYHGAPVAIPEDIDAPDTLIDYVKPVMRRGLVFAEDAEAYRAAIDESFRTCIQGALGEHETVEVMAHPAYADCALMTGSSYNLARVAETDVLVNSRNRAYLAGLNDISLVTYRERYGSGA